MHKWQWYYFDAHTSDGYDLIVILHDRPFMSWFPIIIFDIRLYYQNKIKFHHYLTFPQANLRFEQEPFAVQCNSETYIQQSDDQFFLKAHDARIHLELTFTNLLPNQKTINKEIRLESQNTFFWHIIAPFCSVDGIIRWQGEIIQIKGKGYHDSNSGHGPIRQLIKAWEWGKLYTEDTLYIVSRILNVNAKEIHWALICNENECLVDDSINLYNKGNLAELIFSGQTHHFVQQRNLQLEKIFFFVPSYQKSVKWVEKLREAVLAIIPERNGFIWLRKRFANTEYERKKMYFTDDTGKSVQLFQERMRF